MTRKRNILAIGAVLAVGTFGLTACSDSWDTPAPATREEQLQESQDNFNDRTPPQVTGDTEYNNYIKAQELYDDPANILWCTASFPSATSPLFTTPIAGKLTSSSVSYYPNQAFTRGDGGEYDADFLVEAQSVDGMYHGNPGPYRYGFTPGGQYVDFTNLSVFCTTALTEFQRQTLSLSSDADNGVTAAAEEALKNGDAQGAQDIVDGAAQ